MDAGGAPEDVGCVHAPHQLPDGELMPQGEDLRLELETRPNGGPASSEQGDEQRNHAAADRISLGA